jgi:hypothetical protein
MRTILTAATALLALSAAGMTFAQPVPRSAPVAVPIERTVPDAADVPYPGGPIALDVDASDTKRAAFRVTETIPVAPGTTRLTLLFPQWLPGHHAPRGTLAELTNLTFTAGGKTATWTRDPVEVYAFHVDVPAGALRRIYGIGCIPTDAANCVAAGAERQKRGENDADTAQVCPSHDRSPSSWMWLTQNFGSEVRVRNARTRKRFA